MKKYFLEKTVKFFIICFLIFNVLFVFSVFSEGNGAAEEASEPVTEPYLYMGDTHMVNGELEDARKAYEAVLNENPHDYEALWRSSRFYVLKGIEEEKVKDKKKEWRKAEGYARRAVEEIPDGAEGHLYLAISVGKLALFSSASEKVKSAREIKKEAERAMELDPAQDRAYLALGAWHRNVATASSIEKQLAKMFFGELPEASLDESLKLLSKSISLGGRTVRAYYELALTHEAMKNYEAAKSEFENALNSQSIYREDIEIKEIIEKTLRKSRYNHLSVKREDA